MRITVEILVPKGAFQLFDTGMLEQTDGECDAAEEIEQSIVDLVVRKLQTTDVKATINYNPADMLK